MKNLICQFCSKPFERTNGDFNRGRTKFCTTVCYHKSKVVNVFIDGKKACSRCKNVTDNFGTSKNGYIKAYCRPCMNEVNKISYSKHRESGLKVRKLYHLRKKYGLSLEEYNNLIKNGCEICGTNINLHIDHDHSLKGDGHYRGVLCINCNGGLGSFLDNPTLLREAIYYLESKKMGGIK